jgi:hypothetical protein
MAKGESLEYFDLNIGQNYLSDWSVSFALREIVANAIDEKDEDKFKFNQLDDGTVIIKDYGEGLKPEHFIFQENSKKNRNDKIGKFGFGLKDAIGVLWSKDINVEIRSTGYKFTFEMKEKSKGCKIKTLHACIQKLEEDNFKGTEFTIYNCPGREYEGARDNFIRYKELKILSTTSKGQIIEKDTNSKAIIYLNGMKIAEDNRLKFSYNITSPSCKIKNGLNRERKYVSRSVYQTDLVSIIEKSEEEAVLEILVEQLRSSREGKNMSEITWKNVLVKTCNYVLRNKKTIFVSAEDKEENNEAYKLLVSSREFQILKVSNELLIDIKKYAGSLSVTKLFIEDFLVELQQTISASDLSEKEKEVLDKVLKLLKSIDVLKSEHYLLNDVRLSDKNLAYTDQEKSAVVIPRSCLVSVECCSRNLINALCSIRQGGDQFKDIIIGELCSEFIN